MNLNLLADKLKNEKSVAIFCHMRPDGDTIGSGCALNCALKKLGIKSKVFCSDEIPERFFFLSDTKNILNKIDDDYSAFFAVDNADLTRLGDFAEKFNSFKNTYNVDHHIFNKAFAKINYVNEKASNCENILDLIKLLKVEIDCEIANFIALGIVTDSGNFKNKNVTSETLLNASEVVNKGADLNKIIFNMFTMQSKARAKLFGIVMSKLRYFMDDKIAIGSVFQKDIISCNAKDDETEGFIDFIMGIKGVEVGACVMQISENKFKVSLRSKTADVNKVAATFGGGGHILASGCQMQGEYEEIIDKLSFIISKYIDE